MSRAERQKLGYKFSLEIEQAPIVFETLAIEAMYLLDLGYWIAFPPLTCTENIAQS
jgi:hypothetical protein